MSEDRAASFLQMIRRSQRGRLKIYLGFAPGVGKTYQMLLEGHRLRAEGVDVVVALAEDHGRADTRRLIEGLEVVPRRRVEYHGITVEEMDVDSVLARRPQVCLVDELAHTNVPGSHNAKRYQDVQDLIADGIHVISTLNVQHLESLYNTVEKLLGVKVRERIPDSVLAEADQVVNVDLAAEDLQKRLHEGKIYPAERVAASLENFFTASKLEHLRELTLRELAGQLDFRRRETLGSAASNGDAREAGSPDQVMVCLSSRGPNSARLLRFGSRLAGRLNRNWYAVYVQTPREEPTVIDAATQRLLGETLTLANQLGATVFTFKGTDIPETILRFAREYRVGQIVIGSPHPIPWWRRLFRGERSVAEQLIRRQKGVTIIVVDAEADEDQPAPAVPPKATAGGPTGDRARGLLTSILAEDRVLIFTEPVSRTHVVEALIAAAAATTPGLNPQQAAALIEERESRGSTFLNEGVALPHARVPGLEVPVAALAVTQAGVLDAPTDRPIEVVFLLLTPTGDANSHLKALAAAGRTLQDRDIRRRLSTAASGREAVDALL